MTEQSLGKIKPQLLGDGRGRFFAQLEKRFLKIRDVLAHPGRRTSRACEKQHDQKKLASTKIALSISARERQRSYGWEIQIILDWLALMGFLIFLSQSKAQIFKQKASGNISHFATTYSGRNVLDHHPKKCPFI